MEFINYDEELAFIKEQISNAETEYCHALARGDSQDLKVAKSARDRLRLQAARMIKDHLKTKRIS